MRSRIGRWTVAFVSLLTVPWSAHAQQHTGDPQTTQYQQCLSQAIVNAADEQSVAELRANCSHLLNKKSNDEASNPAQLKPPVQRRFASEVGLMVDRLGFMPHRPNYLLPVSYAKNFNTLGANSDPVEVAFQVSLKLPFTIRSQSEHPDTPVLFFAYTGTAWWQAYNSKRSSPFREYNHSPEIFMFVPMNRSAFGWTTRSFDFGFEHHSNGRDGAESRSWNKLFAKFDLEHRQNYWMSVRTWYRIPEDEKVDPSSAQGDDNPDIRKFYGNFSIRFGYSSNKINWNIMVRRSLKNGGKGAAELTVSYPTRFNSRARWLIRAFDGYGESLIDYNRRVQRFGIGMMLNDWY